VDGGLGRAGREEWSPGSPGLRGTSAVEGGILTKLDETMRFAFGGGHDNS
jgi:hypothetical protein